MRRSFYSVVYVSADGSEALSRTFSTKAAAVKWARYFSRLNTTRVLEGGEGGMEVARFSAQ